MKRNRYILFDITKLILAAIIVLYHYNLFKLSWKNEWLMPGGYLSVECFFVISGFLYMKTIYELNNSEIRVFTILKRKTKGIYLHYFIALVILCVFLFLTLDDKIISVSQVLTAVWFFIGEALLVQEWGLPFFTPAYNGQTWYISAMMLCILILSCCFKVIPAKLRIPFLCTVSFGGYGMLMFFMGNLHVHGVSHFISLGAVRGMVGMACGCLVYFLHRRVPIRAGIYGYILFMICLITLCMISKDSLLDFLMIPIACAICLFSASIVVPDNKTGAFLGKLSYVIFLNQGVVRYALDKVVGQYSCWIYLLGCILFSLFIIKAVDFAFLQFKRKAED